MGQPSYTGESLETINPEDVTAVTKSVNVSASPSPSPEPTGPQFAGGASSPAEETEILREQEGDTEEAKD